MVCSLGRSCRLLLSDAPSIPSPTHKHTHTHTPPTPPPLLVSVPPSASLLHTYVSPTYRPSPPFPPPTCRPLISLLPSFTPPPPSPHNLPIGTRLPPPSRFIEPCQRPSFCSGLQSYPPRTLNSPRQPVCVYILQAKLRLHRLALRSSIDGLATRVERKKDPSTHQTVFESADSRNAPSPPCSPPPQRYWSATPTHHDPSPAVLINESPTSPWVVGVSTPLSAATIPARLPPAFSAPRAYSRPWPEAPS